MINKETLKQYAKIRNLSVWQAEKEYIQLLTLYSLKDFKLVFKGGTYLSLFHNLPRFSEDLDFTMLEEISIQEIKMAIENTFKSFSVETKIKKIKENKMSLSLRIEAMGPLYTTPLSKVFVYVEISKREKPILKPLTLMYENDLLLIPRFTVLGLDLKEIMAEKIRAIYTRNKGRDLYDLYFLIKKGIRFDDDLVNEKLSYYNLTFDKETFLKKIHQSKQFYDKDIKNLTQIYIPWEEIVEKVENQFKKGEFL